jgi:hypothetical protein
MWINSTYDRLKGPAFYAILQLEGDRYEYRKLDRDEITIDATDPGNPTITCLLNIPPGCRFLGFVEVYCGSDSARWEAIEYDGMDDRFFNEALAGRESRTEYRKGRSEE